MKKTLNVGIIGFGYMGKMHSMCYDNLKYYYNCNADVRLYAVATSKKPEEIPVKFEKYYTSWEELLDDENVDIADICGPNYLHANVLKKAMEKKKYIYSEKPLTANLAEAESVMAHKTETGYDMVNRVCFEYRFVPAVIRAKQMIEAGDIGKLIHFNFRYYGCEFLDPNRSVSWQSTKELSGGGVLYAMGTHAIDLIRYLVGDVEEVFAQQRTHFKERPLKDFPTQMKKVETEDIVNAQLTCRGDIVGNLMLSQVAAGSGIDLTFEIYGEKGAIKFDHCNANVIYYFNNEDPKDPVGGYGGFKAVETTQKYGGNAVFPPQRVTISWLRYHIASVYDFVEGIINGEDRTPNIGDAYKVQQITEAIYRSAQSGRIEKVAGAGKTEGEKE